MKKLCIITPDSQDRPQFIEHCVYQASRQTVPVKHYVISRKLEQGKPDLTAKIKAGVNLAYQLGFTHCVIMENDDYYPDDYIETIMEHEFDLFGIEQTIYYNIALRKYNFFEPEGRSSLFMTAFKVEAILDYPWPADTEVYLDFHMWKHFNVQFNENSLSKNVVLLQDHDLFNTPVGIKHGLGACGGNGHHESEMYTKTDDELKVFKSLIKRPESFQFYKKIMENLHYQKLNLIKP